MKYIYLLASLIIIGCSSNNDKSVAKIIDPVTTASIVVSIDDLPNYWQYKFIAKPKNPQTDRDIHKSNCVNIAFVIGEDGLVHNPKIIKVTPSISKRFHKSALKAIKQFTFTPSETNTEKKRVISNYIFIFYNPVVNLTDRQFEHFLNKLKSSCAVSNA